MSGVKYMVESALYMDSFTTETPEQAAQAFFRMFPGTTRCKVFVADYIGDFYPTEGIGREQLPRITKPDGPNAMKTVAGPNNISKL